MNRMVLVYSVNKCNDLCFTDHLQVWITQLYIEHLQLVVDLKSDSILIVVSSFFLSAYVRPVDFKLLKKKINK